MNESPSGFLIIEKGMSQAQRREIVNHNFQQCLRIVKGDGDSIFVDQMLGTAIVRLGDGDDEKTAGGAGGGGGGTVGGGTHRIGRLSGPTSTAVVDARGNAVQWLYSIVEVKPGATTAYDEWGNHVDGYSGPARNLKEDGNTGIGVQGNGIDLDADIFTDNSNLMMQPINGLVFFDLKQAEDGEICAWFSEPNAIAGECGGS